MIERMRNKALKVLELAMLINSEQTQREYTGNKPTIFVNFSGHCCSLDVEIHLNGWDRVEPYNNYDISKVIYLYMESAETVLDGTIEILEKIYNEWEKK